MRKLLIVFLVASMLFTATAITACRPVSDTASQAEQAVQEVLEAVDGGEFNKFFPAVDDSFNLVYTQEKEGFAQAKLEKDGAEVATLSVSDTANNLEAKNKFADSGQEIAGYPAATVGNLGTAILVADRFQIQIRSKDDSFTAEDREAWLAKFGLDGIAGLK